MRSLRFLIVLLLAGCAAGPAISEDGDDFRSRFTSLTGDDAGAINGFEARRDAAPELGTWMITGGRVTPWASSSQHDALLPNAALEGGVFTIGATHVQADAPLGCADADVEFVVTTAEGLFQGGLPEPAAAAARELGIEHARTLSARVQCETGIFDYHHTAGDTLLVALDNVIWKLAPARAATPAGTIRALLAQHMAGDMHFTSTTVARIRHLLSTPLASDIAEYLAQPDADEPPPINGDPFTDSQEHPERFAFAGTVTGDARAIVRVVFSWEARSRPVDFLLVLEPGGSWLVEDIRYDDGSTLRELLRT